MLKAWLYRGFNCKIFAIFVTATLSFGAVAEPAIQVQIMTFAKGTFWEATRTLLEPNPAQDREAGGRYASTTTEPFFASGNCGDILQVSQLRPLEVMKQNGYIDELIFQKLMNFEKLGIQSEQVDFITQFSDLTPQQEREIFGPQGAPPSRVMGGVKGLKPGLRRISRGTIFIVRGYVLTEDANGKIVPKPAKMPWELAATTPKDLSRHVDRAKIPYVVELGRVHVEEVLPGKLDLSMHFAASLLANQLHTLMIDPKEVLVTGNFLDAQHTRFFTRMFKMRLLTDDSLSEIEAGGRVPENYTDLSLPRGPDEWAQQRNTVCFTSAGHMQIKFPIEALSARAHKIQSLAPKPISGIEAQAVVRDYTTNMREDFDFVWESVGRARAPLMISDFGTPLIGYKMLATFLRRGFPYDESVNIPVEYLGRFQTWIAPDMFMSNWLEKLNYLPINPATGQLKAATFVSNLDVELAKKMGVLYPAAVLLSVADHIEKRIEAFAPREYNDLRDEVNKARRAKGLPLVSKVEAEEFFETFPLYLGTEEKLLFGLIKELGGRAETSQAFRANFLSGPITSLTRNLNISVSLQPTTVYGFDGKKIRQLRELYHAINQNARQRLRKGLADTQTKLLNSGSL